ncbi:MAG: ribosomal-protein-alanine N-acetyltransferase [Betaproteobacteria bacterium]|nr:ribosomal-protein-alanine N-acetyltransferase [Betaproteobacteria bacterium]
MRLEDLGTVVQMETRIYEFPWSKGNFSDSLSAGYSCWMLFAAGVPAGYAVVMIGVEEAHLLNLSIAMAWQRQGLGKKFMEHLRGAAKTHEARRFLLEVRESNWTARKFYAVQGFTELGVRRYYYPAREGREDAVIMELKM